MCQNSWSETPHLGPLVSRVHRVFHKVFHGVFHGCCMGVFPGLLSCLRLYERVFLRFPFITAPFSYGAVKARLFEGPQGPGRGHLPGPQVLPRTLRELVPLTFPSRISLPTPDKHFSQPRLFIAGGRCLEASPPARGCLPGPRGPRVEDKPYALRTA